jgi:hypothetical protein
MFSDATWQPAFEPSGAELCDDIVIEGEGVQSFHA